MWCVYLLSFLSRKEIKLCCNQYYRGSHSLVSGQCSSLFLRAKHFGCYMLHIAVTRVQLCGVGHFQTFSSAHHPLWVNICVSSSNKYPPLVQEGKHEVQAVTCLERKFNYTSFLFLSSYWGFTLVNEYRTSLEDGREHASALHPDPRRNCRTHTVPFSYFFLSTQREMMSVCR